MTPWPAVVPLPYSLVWFEPAVAHVHLFVSWLGLTPGLLVAFGVPEQPANFEPADTPAPADTETDPDAELVLEACSWLLSWSWLFAETEADADPDAESVVEACSWLLPWSWLFAETDAESDCDAELLDWAPPAAPSSLLPLP